MNDGKTAGDCAQTLLERFAKRKLHEMEEAGATEEELDRWYEEFWNRIGG